jgi:hypothetical protein
LKNSNKKTIYLTEKDLLEIIGTNGKVPENAVYIGN